MEQISTLEMTADGMTKPLGKVNNAKFVRLLGMVTEDGITI